MQALRIRFFHLLPLLLILLVASCSGGGSASPIDAPLEQHQSVFSATPQNRYTWGFWKIQISADHQNAEVIPARAAEMHLNVVRLLEETACTNCLTINNVTLYPANELAVDLTLKHPFAGYINYTAFDVRGIFISPSDYTFLASGRKISWGADMARIMNADGYTTLFNPTEFPESGGNPPILRYFPGKYSMDDGDLSCTLNPYIAYAEDVERRMFAAGSSKTRTVRLRLPDGPLEFGYAVDGCWTFVDQVTNPLTDFPPDANCLEAYRIDVTIGAGLNPGVVSAVPVEVGVFDHQGLATISSVSIECPDVFTGAQELTYSSQISDESWLYTGTITNEIGADVGEYPLLVRVTDTGEDQNLGVVDAWEVGTVEVGLKQGWVRTWGNEEIDRVYSASVDINNNKYIYGTFNGSVDFDPGSGVAERTSIEGDDCYLSKFDSDGNFLWVNTLDGWSSAMVTDEAGNVFIIGWFEGTDDFNPGPEIDEHTSYGDNDAFLCKFDTNGNYQWARTWGSALMDLAIDIGIDYAGNVYITGLVSNETFDPGSGIFETHDEGGPFINKFNSDGDYQWILKIQGDCDFANQKMPNLCIDEYANIYISSIWGSTVDFDPGPVVDERTACTMFDIYLQKFDSNGIYQWVRTWGSGIEFGARDVAVDEAGNIYVLGLFYDKVDFDPGTGVEEHWAQLDGPMTVSKFYPNGEFQWVRIFGGDPPGTGIVKCDGRAMCIDNAGDILVTGEFRDTVDLDPGPGIDNHVSGGYTDAFLLKMHPSGEFEWARTWGGIYSTRGYDLATDNLNNIYVTGPFMETVDFDPGPGVEEYTSNGGHDVFLSKFPPDGNW